MIDSPEEVFDRILSILKAKLVESLRNARLMLSYNLSKQLSDMVENFESSVLHLNLPENSEVQIIAMARELGGDLAARCNSVSNWFNIAETESIKIATIMDVINAVAKGAQFRQGDIPNVDIQATCSAGWREVETWFIVLYILFDNARKASTTMAGEGNIVLYTRSGENNTIQIGCRNRLASEEEAAEAVFRITQRLSSSRQFEMLDLGGTGLLRACDLLGDLSNLERNLETWNSKEWIWIQFILKQV